MARSVVLRILVAGALVAVLTPPAAAQKTTLPGFVVKRSNEPAIIAGQLRMAIEQGRAALAGLQAALGGEPLATAHAKASNAYVLIRSARAGMADVRVTRKFPDPMLDYAYERTTRAWNLSRTPVDRLSWGMAREKYLEISIHDLDAALRILGEVLTVWP
jgi:hypothetical protein